MLSKNKLKQIRKLHRKKGREEQGLTIAEGAKVVSELVAYNQDSIEDLYVQAGVDFKSEGDVVEVDARQMQEISLMETPPGILAVVKTQEKKVELTRPTGVYLYLDGIRDPGNMGTIIRTALWFGVEGIVCSPDCVEPTSPKVIQSSMGAVFRIPLTTESVDVLSKVGMDIYGAVMDGENLHKVSFKTPGCLVIGNESNGISNEVENVLTTRVTIPGSGAMESLNAATATAIILSHIFR